jgi:hypothetical protein
VQTVGGRRTREVIRSFLLEAPADEPTAHGSPLCQDAVGRAVVGSVVAGPGSDWSEEPVWGCEPAALNWSVPAFMDSDLGRDLVDVSVS